MPETEWLQYAIDDMRTWPMKNYIDLFFRLRPKFLADARANKVSANTIPDWIRENAPEYEEASKEAGFPSLEAELRFMRILAKQIKGVKDMQPYLRILRSDKDISRDARFEIVEHLEQAMDCDQFPEEMRYTAEHVRSELFDYAIHSPKNVKRHNEMWSQSKHPRPPREPYD